MASSVPTSSQNVERVFYQVSKNSTDKVKNDLTKIFVDILTPLYGSQDDALNKIFLGKDRVCHLLYERETPVGVIAFKTELSDEFAPLGVEKSIEIKSLFVVNATNNSGRGLGSVLVDKVLEEVKKLALKQMALHVTVSETKKESLIFFLNKDFKIVHIWKDRYKSDVKEYLLSYSSNQEKENQVAQQVSQLAKNLNLVSAKDQDLSSFKNGVTPKVIGFTQNAHWDDIHALKLLSDGSFISGSKDNTLRKWNADGKMIRMVSDVEPAEVDSKNWITAIGTVNDEYWVSGERSGRVSLWSTAGDYIRDLTPKLPNPGHVSHEYNTHRVNCLATGLNKQKPSFFIGFPKIFDEYNIIENRTVSLTKASNNDWVYCIHPLDEKRLLTVTAGYLNLWTKVEHHWKRGPALISELKKESHSRRHISCLSSLDSSPNRFAAGAFDGSIKIVDLLQGKSMKEWKEHEGKIWAIENVSRDVFASGGEDGVIKLWDIRENKSVSNMKVPEGGVSTLLRLNQNVLISGSCVKEQLEVNKGAQLTFYDIRQ